MLTAKKGALAKKRQAGFEPVGTLFDHYQVGDSGKYISREFQDFGYRLAVKLDDLEHKSLYIKLAKKEDRWLLEKALSYVSDAKNVKSKARLFMWKIKQLKKGQSKKSTLNTNLETANLKKANLKKANLKNKQQNQ